MQVLQRSRITASATLSGGSVNVPANGSALCKAIIDPAIKNLPENSLVRVSLLRGFMQTDAGGAGFLKVQSANLNAGTLAAFEVTQPAYTGSPLGFANLSSFQGEVRFHSEDLAQLADVAVQLGVNVSNGDASAHNVTSLNVTVLVEIVTFDGPVYAESLWSPI